jgi:hypothetical protein
MKQPRILVGCPTCDLKEGSLEQYLQGIDSLTYPAFDVAIEDNSKTITYSQRIMAFGRDWEKRHPGQTFRVIQSGYTSAHARERVVNGRNKIREIALKERYDYFFSLEQDVVPPPAIIENLLNTQKDIVSGVYYTKKFTPTEKKYAFMAGIAAGPVQETEKGKGFAMKPIGIDFLFPTRVAEVMYTGLGCMLIAREALEKTPFRYEPEHSAWDDVFFCIDSRIRGHPTFLHTVMLAAHHYDDAMQKTQQ